MRQRGVTLVEIVVTTAILATLALLAAPPLVHFIRDNRLTAATNQLHRSLMLSRSYAIRHASEVVMCKSHDQISCSRTGGWDQGWIIFSDPDGDRRCLDTDRDARCDSDGGYLVRTSDGIVRSGVSVTASGNPSRRVVFTPEGFADGYMGTFSVCDERGATAARGLKLIMSGRIVAAHPGNQLLRCP